MRPRYNREHLFEPKDKYNQLHLPHLVRNAQHHIGRIAVWKHDKMNAELQPHMPVMSDNLCREVLEFIEGQPLLRPEERWRVVEREEIHLRRLGHERRNRMIGREALFFAEAIEAKLNYWRPDYE